MSRHTQTQREGFDTVIAGRDACIEFDRITTYCHDAHYGADADGNRGVPMDFIDDDYAENITAQFSGDDDHPTASILNVASVVEQEIDAYLKRVEPTPEEDDDGPDPDRLYDEWIDRQLDERR